MENSKTNNVKDTATSKYKVIRIYGDRNLKEIIKNAIINSTK